MNRILLLVISSLLFSCRQYKNKSIVPVSTQKLPVSKNITGKSRSVTQPKLTAWKTLFKDATLKELIGVALANNRDIRRTVANIDAVRATYQLKHITATPVVGATGTFTKTSQNQSRVDTFSSNYNVGLAVSNYELDFFGRVKNQNDAALSDYFKSIEAKRTAKLTVIAETAKAYYGYQIALAKAHLSDSTLRAAKKSRSLLKMRVSAGLSSHNVVDQVDASIARIQSQKSGIEQEKIAYHSALRQIAGTDVGRFLAKRKPAMLSLSLPKNLSSTVLLNRPDVIRSELDLYAADANINAARAAFFPSVTISNNMGFVSTDLTKLFSVNSFLWQFSPTIRLPIFNRVTNQANLNLAEARKVVAVADYEKVIQTAFAEVYRAAKKVRVLSDTFKAQEKATTAQRRILASTVARYDAGLINYVDVLNEQQTLYSAQLSEFTAKLAILQNHVDLYQALGGADDLDEQSRQMFFEILKIRANDRFPVKDESKKS